MIAASDIGFRILLGAVIVLPLVYGLYILLYKD